MHRHLAAALSTLLSVPCMAQTSSPQQLPIELTRSWAILADGRTKPLDTFARETITAVVGKAHFDGLSALEIFWGYCLAPKEFSAREYVRVDSKELKALVGLSSDRKRFSFHEVMNNEAFRAAVKRADDRRRDEAELASIEKDALATYRKLELVHGLTSGRALTIVPADEHGLAWTAPVELSKASRPQHQAVYAQFAKLAKAYEGGDASGFVSAANALTPALRAVAPSVYPSDRSLTQELFYNDFNAFRKAWMLYLAGFFVILWFGFAKRNLAYRVGLAILIGGFVCHSTGIALRWMIAERAPVSDMYESLVFMGWGVIAIGLTLELLYRRRFFALASGVMGFICLAFAENLPLDSSINPLVPVLAHTSWLSVHVMTIMLSYSAFALTMALGHVVIAIQLFRPGKGELLTNLSTLLYKSLQVGLLFLAAGIIFGAVWANESWGRYWGWDPKETWSLITFFVYLGIVHARFAGWLHHFGLAVSAIVGFLSVLMTYYGVNFILGAGLHSYGFASGGMLWVGVYLLAELAIIVGATIRYRSAVQARLARSATV